MPNLKQVIDAYAASCPNLERASLSRLDYWLQALGHHEVATLTPAKCTSTRTAIVIPTE